MELEIIVGETTFLLLAAAADDNFESDCEQD